jgi:hypothetical protein
LDTANILCLIVQTIYAVRTASSRHLEAATFEGLLDKWYLELPEHLRFDVGAATAGKAPAPLPNVLTLHMQYWCAVLLLHRPFIRHVVQAKQRAQQQQGEGMGVGGQGVVGTGMSEDPEMRAIAVKRYELCNAAANHITSIGEGLFVLPNMGLLLMFVAYSVIIPGEVPDHSLPCVPVLLCIYCWDYA